MLKPPKYYDIKNKGMGFYKLYVFFLKLYILNLKSICCLLVCAFKKCYNEH
jgi:hypothetical protein